MKRLSVRLKLTVWFVGVLMIILALYSAWIGFLLWRNLGEALEHHLDEDLQFAVQMIEWDASTVVWRGAADHDPGYEGGVRRWVEVWSPDGRLLFRRGSPETESLQKQLPPALPSEHAQIFDTPLGRLRIIARSLDLHGSQVILRVARTERTEWDELEPTLLALVLGIPIGLIAAGLGGYVMARRALAPVGEMAERARLISAEQLHARLPVLNPQDELGQLATVFNDTFARLEQSFSSLQRFTADASHELRTPLTALRSVGEVGLSGSRTPDDYRDVIGSMLEEAERLRRLVDGLLLLSRADGGHTSLVRERAGVCASVRATVAQLGVLAEEKGQTIQVTAPDDLTADIDRAVFGQAVANLLDNAIKYGPAGSRIQIVVRQDGDDGIIEISDEGPGIAPEDQDRIFERFYRTDKARSREMGGSGLGLSIARWAVELHGGRLTLVPDAPHGACFRITIPLTTPTAS